MRQFVLLHHECPSDTPRPTHFDLMLEEKGVLRTFVLPEWSALRPPGTASLEVEEIQPHRLDYLELEGPLSRGRGCVRRVDRGSMPSHEFGPLRICVELLGQSVRGSLELTRWNRSAHHWLLKFSPSDGAAG